MEEKNPIRYIVATITGQGAGNGNICEYHHFHHQTINTSAHVLSASLVKLRAAYLRTLTKLRRKCPKLVSICERIATMSSN